MLRKENLLFLSALSAILWTSGKIQAWGGVSAGGYSATSLSPSGYYGRGNEYYHSYRGVSTSGYYGRGNEYYHGYSGISTSGYYGRGNESYQGGSSNYGRYYSSGVRSSPVPVESRELRSGVVRTP